MFVIWCLGFGYSALAASNSLDPMSLGVGARSLAMGRTNTVLPGDINALFVNPANAAYLEDWGATSMYTSLLEGDIAYTLLGGAKKTIWGGIGVAYLGGGTSAIPTTTRDADSRIGGTGSAFDYSNTTITLAYGKELKPDLSAGGSIKLFSKSFSGQSSGSGFDMDLGLLYKLRNGLDLGLTLQNVLPEGMGGLNWGTGVKEDMAMGIKGGLNWQIRQGLLWLADADLSPFSLHTGIEWQPLSVLALRGGLEQVPIGSTTNVTNLGAGVGLMYRGIHFDYAYFKDGSLDANSTHFFTLSFVPEIQKAKAVEKPVAQPAEKLVPVAQPVVKPVLVKKVKVKAAPPKPKKVVKAKPKPKPKAKPKKKSR